MLDYLRYYLSPLVQVLTALGIFYGGPWVWMGIASLPVLAVIDSLMPFDTKERKIQSRILSDIPLWFCVISGLGLYVLLAWKIGQGGISAVETLGAAMSVAWVSVVVGVPATHELYHQRGFLHQLIGNIGQVVYLDCSRNIAHMSGHHLDVGTDKDCDTAERGESLYSFSLKAVYHSTAAAWRLESDALEKRGHGRWSIRHRVWKSLAALGLLLGGMYLVGGSQALAWGGITVCLARFWVESFNFFQHYGQVRVEGTPIARRHVWNHLRTISRAITFEITNHADHHLNAYTPYYRLKPDTTAIRLPSVFVCFMAALVPPIWNHFIIKPALKEWDLHYASSAERELAREKNKKAGWPDWFSEISENSVHAN